MYNYCILVKNENEINILHTDITDEAVNNLQTAVSDLMINNSYDKPFEGTVSTFSPGMIYEITCQVYTCRINIENTSKTINGFYLLNLVFNSPMDIEILCDYFNVTIKECFTMIFIEDNDKKFEDSFEDFLTHFNENLSCMSKCLKHMINDLSTFSKYLLYSFCGITISDLIQTNDKNMQYYFEKITKCLKINEKLPFKNSNTIPRNIDNDEFNSFGIDPSYNLLINNFVAFMVDSKHIADPIKTLVSFKRLNLLVTDEITKCYKYLIIATTDNMKIHNVYKFIEASKCQFLTYFLLEKLFELTKSEFQLLRIIQSYHLHPILLNN